MRTFGLWKYNQAFITKVAFLSAISYGERQFNVDVNPIFTKAIHLYWSENKDSASMLSQGYSFSNYSNTQAQLLKKGKKQTTKQRV